MYDFATAPFLISLYIGGKFNFLFYQCRILKIESSIFVILGSNPTEKLEKGNWKVPSWPKRIMTQKDNRKKVVMGGLFGRQLVPWEASWCPAHSSTPRPPRPQLGILLNLRVS
jgi:hypothetical protein